jgi:hypothetical protein
MAALPAATLGSSSSGSSSNSRHGSRSNKNGSKINYYDADADAEKVSSAASGLLGGGSASGLPSLLRGVQIGEGRGVGYNHSLSPCGLWESGRVRGTTVGGAGVVDGLGWNGRDVAHDEAVSHNGAEDKQGERSIQEEAKRSIGWARRQWSEEEMAATLQRLAAHSLVRLLAVLSSVGGAGALLLDTAASLLRPHLHVLHPQASC